MSGCTTREEFQDSAAIVALFLGCAAWPLVERRVLLREWKRITDGVVDLLDRCERLEQEQCIDLAAARERRLARRRESRARKRQGPPPDASKQFWVEDVDVGVIDGQPLVLVKAEEG